MSENTNFHPCWVSAPGETILDLLREREQSPEKFASDMEVSPEFAVQLLAGTARITDDVAEQLAEVLGGSTAFWSKRESIYRSQLETSKPAESLEAKLAWIRSLPLKDMRGFGWIPNVPMADVQAVEMCLRFFDEPDVLSWKRTYTEDTPIAAFRTSPTFDSDAAAVAVWLRQGEIQAASISCSPWSPDDFEAAMPKLRALTRMKNPEQFLPELTRICASAGVAVAIVRAPSGCCASGATRFITPEKALLMLSFRYLTDDHFWFTFFHEAGHLLLHGSAETFLEGMAEKTSVLESEANDFAARTLIPTGIKDEMLRLPLDSREVVRFALRAGISPGIVVGQLQHLGHFTRRQLNDLKRRFSWGE